MAIIRFIRWSINLYNLHLSRRRIQQSTIRHKHDCLRSAHMDIRNIPFAVKEKINSNQHVGSSLIFFLNFAKATNFFEKTQKKLH